MKPELPPRDTVDAWEFCNASPDAEMFCPPSDEAAWLLGRFPELLAPRDGSGSGLSRWLRAFVVAPFTQFTLRSFDLQIFLLDVMHMSWMARVGHLIGMTCVNLFFMAWLVSMGGPWLAATFATLLLGWYRAVAREAGLPAWWGVMVVWVTGLWLGAWLVGSLGWSSWVFGVAIVASGCLITFPHAAESKMPPRAGDPQRWVSAWEYVFGTPQRRPEPLVVLRRAMRVAAYPWIGLVNEIWASPRLMPYNVLRLMLGLGYAPALKRKLDQRRDRAWASGNPAVDYVGIGGGTFIRPRR